MSFDDWAERMNMRVEELEARLAEAERQRDVAYAELKKFASGEICEKCSLEAYARAADSA